MKLKSRSSVAKRFKFTGSGKVKFKRAALRHCLGHRSRNSKLKLKSTGYLTTKGEERSVRKMLPYGN